MSEKALQAVRQELIYNRLGDNNMIQVRSEDTGTCEYHNMEEAIAKVKEDPSVWKVSMVLSNGQRVRLVRQENTDNGFWLEMV